MPQVALRPVAPVQPGNLTHDNPPIIELIGGNGDALRLTDQDGLGFYVGANTRGIFGLPPVEVRQYESAGDGARYGGTRRLPRSIDLQVTVSSLTDSEQRGRLNRLAEILDDTNGAATLRVTCPECGVASSRSISVHYTGGWDGDTNASTLPTFVQLPLTFVALEPYFRAVTPREPVRWGAGTDGKPFLSAVTPLFPLDLPSSQVLGAVDIFNPGDVDAIPTWTIVGPGGPITIAPAGRPGFTVATVLAPGETLVARVENGGSLTTPAGDDAYHLLAPAPRFWRIPKGTSAATVAMDEATAASSVTLTFVPRYKRGM